MQSKSISLYKTPRGGKSSLEINRPLVMGILNITPDSFYGGSRAMSEKQWLRQAENMLKEGAAFLDVGGCSTRPGANDVSEEQEMSRVIPAIQSLKQHFPKAYLSVDTFRSKVAQAAVDEGATMINDVLGGDENMIEVVVKNKIPFVCMHSRGTPQTMSSLTDYKDVLEEVMNYFHQKISWLRERGVVDVVIDPGLGFAKNREQNFLLLKNLERFQLFDCPVMVGLSRKSMIWKTLQQSPEDALNGTTVLNTVALLKGASILRVHDVKEAIEAVSLIENLLSK